MAVRRTKRASAAEPMLRGVLLGGAITLLFTAANAIDSGRTYSVGAAMLTSGLIWMEPNVAT